MKTHRAEAIILNVSDAAAIKTLAASQVGPPKYDTVRNILADNGATDNVFLARLTDAPGGTTTVAVGLGSYVTAQEAADLQDFYDNDLNNPQRNKIAFQQYAGLDSTFWTWAEGLGFYPVTEEII